MTPAELRRAGMRRIETNATPAQQVRLPPCTITGVFMDELDEVLKKLPHVNSSVPRRYLRDPEAG